MFYDQAGYAVRCEWALPAISHIGPISDVIIVVDVLSFSTCVDVAVSRGAVVYPYRFDSDPAEFARQSGAIVAQPRGTPGTHTLSPASLLTIPPGTKLVLPSPNGSTLSLAAPDTVVIAACIRNAQAVARAAQQMGSRILVVPAGERWPDGSLRPCLEDLVGAGAIAHYLSGTKSPEAALAEAAYLSVANDLHATLRSCSSGRELLDRGFAHDVDLASQLNSSQSVPLLTDGAYRESASGSSGR
jgi:2-phosphosulfolactate phosphatase